MTQRPHPRYGAELMFGDEPMTPERAAYLRGYAEGANARPETREGTEDRHIDVIEITSRSAPNVCPMCERGDHWNHEPRKVTRGPEPEAGACYSLGNGERCVCSVRIR